jgi:hypothetical protein
MMMAGSVLIQPYKFTSCDGAADVAHAYRPAHADGTGVAESLANFQSVSDGRYSRSVRDAPWTHRGRRGGRAAYLVGLWLEQVDPSDIFWQALFGEVGRPFPAPRVGVISVRALSRQLYRAHIESRGSR